MVEVPSAKVPGVTVVMIGIGFSTVMVTDPLVSPGKFIARLVIVTVLLGVGTTAGAVKSPLLSIVPSSALPPNTPFTQKLIGDPVVAAWVDNWIVWLTLTVLFGSEI